MNCTGEKLETYRIGPCVVAGRVSKNMYVFQVEEGRRQVAHRSRLKGYRLALKGPPLFLFHFHHSRPEEIPGWMNGR